MSFNEQPSIINFKGKLVAKKHHDSSTKSDLLDTLRLPLKYQIVYSAVVLPQGTTRIFGILYNGKVYTKASAFAPTGVMSHKGFTPLSDRDYNVYKQWLQTPSKSKSRFDAERMQWTEDNAERLIREGNERESERLFGESEYERGKKLLKEFIIPESEISNLKVGDILELQFDKSLYTISSIGKDVVYLIDNKHPDRAPRGYGTKGGLEGYKKL